YASRLNDMADRVNQLQSDKIKQENIENSTSEVDELNYIVSDYELDFIERNLHLFAKEQCENFNKDYLSKLCEKDLLTTTKIYYEKFTEYKKNALKVSSIFLHYNSWKTFLENDKRYILGTNKDIAYHDSSLEKLSPVQQ
ncbi:MAG: hypothetical protein MHPSP_004801, partial [Paramarteilia canceri]